MIVESHGDALFFCLLFCRDGAADPVSADCDRSAEPAADVAGPDPAADLFKGSAKPSHLSPTVNTVAAN